MNQTASDSLKKACARKALSCIDNHTIIGLGGGSTIGYLIGFLREKNLDVKIVTPSEKTKRQCLQSGLEVLHTEAVSGVDVAFDGCDQVDEQLRAMKSGGGIHTKEKLIAQMAGDYILLVDTSKFVRRLTFNQPVVLEILEDAVSYVEKQAIALGGKPAMRTSGAKDGLTISDNGHPLMDVFFSEVEDIDTLQNRLKAVAGVIETSLFTREVTKALVAGNHGMRWITK
ncbi:ribose 5-phosphate isomerase A [Sporolactobacillus sp. THM7-7]|nr:ribose 5-phosphate isomerase A [Sporolactobacillus sp. THM7-7]